MAVSGPVCAQSAARVEAAAGVERLTYRYRFDNDSSFDTPFLVPHFFEQRYERTAAQLALRARYRLLSHTMRTGVSFTPESDAFGSDFDTFFQPDGDLAKSGTAGDVRLATVRLDHAIGVFARQDVEIAVVTAVTANWHIEAVARLYPAIRARLLVQLPDKYPGRDIVFSAAAWSGSGRVTLTRLFGRAAAGAWVSIEQGGSYRRSAEFDRNAAAAGLVIAFGSRR